MSGAETTTAAPRAAAQTLVLDDTLDVARRLVDLRTWEADWRGQDALLEARALALDPRKRIDVQRGAQIDTMRRRLRMQLVQQPLEVTAGVVRRVGYGVLRAHLARQFAALSREERLLWLQNFLFIMTPQIRGLSDKIARVLDHRALGQRRNFLLGGPSGMGKTTYLDWFTSHHLPVVEAERNRVPVVKIDAPVGERTPKPLLQRLVLECGMSYVERDGEEHLLNLLRLLFQQCGVQLVIVDEVEHLVKHEFRRRLLEVSNLTNHLPIICASCHPTRFLEGDAEIAGRWNDQFMLQPLRGTRLRQLLAFLELILPFSQDSSLSKAALEVDGATREGPAVLIERLTGGILRDIMILLVDASGRAIRQDAPALSTALLAKPGRRSRPRGCPTSSTCSGGTGGTVPPERATPAPRPCAPAVPAGPAGGYHFDVLPLHPRPAPLESLTGYLGRLAALNGLAAVGRLSALCFPAQNPRIAGRLADYPPLDLGPLAAATAAPEAVLRATTFAHLGEKFGRAGHPQGLARLLAGAVAADLRWCPACLAARPYHRLPWRLLPLAGCPGHGLRLLDRCGHCGARVPLLAAPGPGICPACGGDLGACAATPLDAAEARVAARRLRDLAFLLRPAPVGPPPAAYPRRIGGALAATRRAAGLTAAGAGALAALPETRINDLEQGSVARHGAPLSAYVRYADALGLSLHACCRVAEAGPGGTAASDVRAARPRPPTAPTPPRDEAAMVGAARAAAADLEARGLPATQAAVAAALGIARRTLRDYPRVVALLAEQARRRRLAATSAVARAAREEALRARVLAARDRLVARDESPTQARIAARVGLTTAGLRRYPSVRAALEQLRPPGGPGRRAGQGKVR